MKKKGRHVEKKKSSYFTRRNGLLVSSALFLLFLVSVSALHTTNATVSSSPEPKFTDASAHGLAIVPASGASTPAYDTSTYTSTYTPTGYLDSQNCDANGVHGWAYDPAQPSSSIDVSIAIDGVTIQQLSANVSRPDVDSAIGVSGNHGFLWTIPDSYHDGANHTISVTAIGADTNAQLPSSDPSQGGAVDVGFTCPNPAPPPSTPNACPSGETLGSDGQCETPTSACPSGEVLGSDGQCHTPSTPICPDGSTPQSDGSCPAVSQNCPSDELRYSDGSCEISSCPSGQTLVYNSGVASCEPTASIDSTCPSGYVLSGGVCVSAGASAPLQSPVCLSWESVTDSKTGVVSWYCANECYPSPVCSGNDIVNSCTGAALASCSMPWSAGCSEGTCLPPPPPQVTQWSVKPTLVRSGSTVTVTWNTINARTCAIQGTDGESWTDLSATETSNPIVAQTIFSLLCTGYPGSNPATASDSTTVNVVPTFQEQ